MQVHINALLFMANKAISRRFILFGFGTFI